MKYILAILLFCYSFMVKAQQSVDQNWPGKLIEGTWKMVTKNGSVIGETWKKINDNYYQSTGFMIKEKDTVVTERVALKRTSNAVFYTSTAEDQNNGQPVSFRLTSSNNNNFVFENREHDFPKRIVYEFTGDKTLHAYIDEGPEGKKRRHFYYNKE